MSIGLFRTEPGRLCSHLLLNSPNCLTSISYLIRCSSMKMANCLMLALLLFIPGHPLSHFSLTARGDQTGKASEDGLWQEVDKTALLAKRPQRKTALSAY